MNENLTQRFGNYIIPLTYLNIGLFNFSSITFMFLLNRGMLETLVGERSPDTFHTSVTLLFQSHPRFSWVWPSMNMTSSTMLRLESVNPSVYIECRSLPRRMFLRLRPDLPAHLYSRRSLGGMLNFENVSLIPT